MRRRRWPDGAESHRVAAIQCIKHARNLMDDARRNAKVNPDLQAIQIADAQRMLSDAERFLVLARLGVDDEDGE